MSFVFGPSIASWPSHVSEAAANDGCTIRLAHSGHVFFAPLVNESITRLVRTLPALRRRRVGQNGERGKRRRWPRCDDQLLRVAHLELAGADCRRLFKIGHPFL